MRSKIDANITKNEKKYYREMKKIYALPVDENKQAENDALTQALIKGEDISALLQK